jgi:hypothetical protein
LRGNRSVRAAGTELESDRRCEEDHSEKDGDVPGALKGQPHRYYYEVSLLFGFLRGATPK